MTKKKEEEITPIPAPSVERNLFYNLKRVAFDVALFTSLVMFLFFTPYLDPKDKYGLINGLLSVALRMTAGFLHAHIIRKLAFPYLDLGAMAKDGNSTGVAFVGAIYVVVILGWARGG